MNYEGQYFKILKWIQIYNPLYKPLQAREIFDPKSLFFFVKSKCKDPFIRCDSVCDKVNVFLMQAIGGIDLLRWTLGSATSVATCTSMAKPFFDVVADALCEWTFMRIFLTEWNYALFQRH